MIKRLHVEYKISELVAQTNVPKSTILYYIREGLLPEAKKLKSNVHRYNDEHVELIRYIKYMKEEIGSTNEQIKFAQQNKNQSLSSSFSMIEPLMNTLSSIPADAVHYTKEKFIEVYDIDPDLLNRLLDDGILVPISENDFTDKEASIVKLVTSFYSVDVDYTIIKYYLHHAKAMIELEHRMQPKLCEARTGRTLSELW